MSTTMILNLISPFSSFDFCFTYFGDILFTTYTYRVAMSSWWIDSLIIIHHYVLFCLVIFFVPKSISLSDFNMITSAFLWIKLYDRSFSILLLLTCLYIVIFKVSFLLTSYDWVIFLNHSVNILLLMVYFKYLHLE